MGPRDLLFVPNWGSNLDAMWEEPSLAFYFHRLGSIGWVICFDKRGSGISDPVPLASLPTLEEWMDDARVVLDAVGSEQAAVIGDYVQLACLPNISMLKADIYASASSFLSLHTSCTKRGSLPRPMRTLHAFHRYRFDR